MWRQLLKISSTSSVFFPKKNLKNAIFQAILIFPPYLPDVSGRVEVGDAVVVTGGAWKDTTGLIQSINDTKQMVTINVELFGRETPVEISFAEVKKM